MGGWITINMGGWMVKVWKAEYVKHVELMAQRKTVFADIATLRATENRRSLRATLKP